MIDIDRDDSDNQILTGAELMRTAIDDWQWIDDMSLFDWYPELTTVRAKRKYLVTSELLFEEVTI
jgi:hypothetical protein